MIRLATLLTCLVLASCGAAPSQASRSVDRGAEATLAPGESVAVKTTDITVRFVAVTEDSRCPRDVTCIWAGEVKARFEISAPPAVSQVEILAGGNVLHNEYRVTLLRVDPQPVGTAKIAPADYRATVKID